MRTVFSGARGHLGVPAGDAGCEGSATVATMLAVVALLGVCGAFLATTLRSQIEREQSVEDYAAVQVADAGVVQAMANLVLGTEKGEGSHDAPVAFGSGDYWSSIEDNGDGTYTIVAYSEVGRAGSGVECVVEYADENDVYSNAVFAGNSSGDGGYSLKINGTGAYADEIWGDIYSGGSINVLQDAQIHGDARAKHNVSGVDGEEGVSLPTPDIAAMDYANTANFNVSKLFSSGGAYYAKAAVGGWAWQLPESSPGHVFRKNPSDRGSRLSLTKGDDYFLEDPYEPVRADSKTDGSDPTVITLSGVGGEPGVSSNQSVFYIDGNLWLDSLGTYSFMIKHGTEAGVQVTFVVKGNIYIGDNLFYEDTNTDGVAFIAIKDPSVKDSGNIYLGDSTLGTLNEMHAFMYAENDFYDLNLDKYGSDDVTLYGNMTAGNQVSIQRDNGSKHTKLTIDFDGRVQDGSLDMPGLPSSSDDEALPEINVLSWRIIGPYADAANVGTQAGGGTAQ